MSSCVNTQLWRNLRRSGFQKYDFGLWPSYSKLKSRKRSEWTSSHHRKMMFEGDWGCCPNKRMSKSSKQGPVYTACEFVNLYRFALLANLWTVKISLKLFPTLESFRCVTCGQFVHKLKSAFSFFELVTNLGTSYFYSRRVGGDFTFRQFVGKLWRNFRPTWSEAVCRCTDWQAVESGTTFRFLKIPSGTFCKNACKGSIPGTLWTVSLILATQLS